MILANIFVSPRRNDNISKRIHFGNMKINLKVYVGIWELKPADRPTKEQNHASWHETIVGQSIMTQKKEEMRSAAKCIDIFYQLNQAFPSQADWIMKHDGEVFLCRTLMEYITAFDPSDVKKKSKNQFNRQPRSSQIVLGLKLGKGANK